MKKRTLQDRNRANTQRRRRLVVAATLWVEGLSRDERELLRGRLPYTGAGETYIATYADELALASSELLRLRPNHVAVVACRDRGFVLTSVPANDRELVFRRGFRQGIDIAGAVLKNAIAGVPFGPEIEDSAWAATAGVLERFAGGKDATW